MKKSNKQDLVKTIANRAQSVDHWSYLQYLPNPDPILKKMGKDITAYREIMVDATVGSAIKRRKAAIKKLDWRITEDTPTREGELLDTLFNNMDLNQLLNEMLDACLFGYSVLEIMWAYQDGLYLPVSIVGKPPEWFVFDEDNNLRLRTKKNPINGEALPPNKFLVAVQNGSYNNPYGLGDLALCFWPAVFKRGGLKYWFQYTEKYGAPWAIAKHKRGATTDEIDLILDSLEALMGNSVGAFPLDAEIEIKSATDGQNGGGDAYEKLLRWCRSEISIALLGQNQTTESDTNHASASAGLEVAGNIRDDDAELVMGVMNTQLIRAIYELNFNSTTRAKFELYEQASIDTAQAERDVLLTQTGAKFSPAYYKRTYDLDDGDLIVEATEPGTTVSFAEEPDELAPEFVLEGAVKMLANPIQQWHAQVYDFFQAEGPEAARARLAELMPQLDDAALTEQLARVIFVSELYGRLTAKAEQDHDA